MTEDEIPVRSAIEGALYEIKRVIVGQDAMLDARPADPEALRQIAQTSGGKAFEATDGDQLAAVYERLGTREETREVTAGFAAAGLLLLGGALAGSVRWFGRLP